MVYSYVWPIQSFSQLYLDKITICPCFLWRITLKKYFSFLYIIWYFRYKKKNNKINFVKKSHVLSDGKFKYSESYMYIFKSTNELVVKEIVTTKARISRSSRKARLLILLIHSPFLLPSFIRREDKRRN